MKYVWTFVVAFIVGLYTAFVAMCMWNWFAVQALNVPSISFLQMLGLVWLISILTNRPDQDEIKWKSLFVIIEQCVPEEKREIVKDAIQDIQDNIWIDLSSKIVGQIVGNTVTLILGFVLYNFIG